MYQPTLFEVPVTSICVECTFCIDHDWYNERYRYCGKHPTIRNHKLELTVIKPNDKACRLFKRIKNYKDGSTKRKKGTGIRATRMY